MENSKQISFILSIQGLVMSTDGSIYTECAKYTQDNFYQKRNPEKEKQKCELNN
jgi:hypothetical protein